MARAGGWVLLLGTAVFFAAAFAPTSRVFTIGEADERVCFLEARAATWRRVQPLFGAGAIVTAVGIGVLALGLDGWSLVYAGVAAVLALVGAVPWAVTCRLRGQRITDFAHGRLPGWHYLVYVWCTLVALALLGAALLASSYPGWVGWFVLGADGAFCLFFVVTRDLPPFVFYTVTAVVGAMALRQ